MSEEIRVSIVGRNEIVREGLKRILLDQSFIVEWAVAESETLSRSIDSSNPPDLIIVDGHSDNKNYDVCRDLHSQFPQSHIVLMADECQVDDVANAFGAGVVGYLVKAISCEPLGSALRLVAHGETVIPSQIVEAIADPVWRNGARALDTGKLDLNRPTGKSKISGSLLQVTQTRTSPPGPHSPNRPPHSPPNPTSTEQRDR